MLSRAHTLLAPLEGSTRLGAEAAGAKRTRLAVARRVSDERAYLYELIQTISAGPDLEAILRGVVGLVTEATDCHACFIYFMDPGGLSLRAASGMYQHLEGEVVIPVGEGLTGWVAQTRRSAFVKEGALDDPRVRRAYFAELGDEVYQSLVSVPIFARAGDVIGVITLHAEAPHEFVRSDLDFLEHTASLIGGAVENARLYEEATSRVQLLSELSRLSQRIASADSRSALLGIVADGLTELLEADRCEIFLTEQAGLLKLAMARPPRAAPPPVDPRRLNLAALEAPESQPRTEENARIARVLWGDAGGLPLIASLDAGGEQLGLICITPSSRSTEVRSALAGVAAHAAVALRQHRVIEDLREQNLLKDFFQALAKGDAPEVIRDLSSRVSTDLEMPHVVLHVVPWQRRGRAAGKPAGQPMRWRELAGQVEAKLNAAFPGILIDRLERSLRAILPLAGSGAAEELASLRSMGWGEDLAGGVSLGVSNVCVGAPAYVRGFYEAGSAAEVGALIRGTPGVTAYDDLGPYRYVLGTDDAARDRTQQRLERLVEYDAKRGTQLLDTVDAYLEHRGNVAKTSRALFIHPNTLRQRLARAERVTGIELERDDWLTLGVATKVVKLRRMRREARGERGSDGKDA